MPYATNGKALLLLSGGIDSPVAGWLMAKRGVELEAVHFHSYPYTSERAKEKVISLARILAEYCRVIKLHIVNLLEIQQAIRSNCPEEIFTIISRRYMMFIAEKIAVQNECLGLITGESIGQVASQTIQSLAVTNAAVDLPIFRPLICMDKAEITGLAQKIETYETSILPYEDCCTVFLPKRPAIKPKLEKILKAETGLDRETLIKNALDNMEVLLVKPY
jgi:thiamine biosynthesis protein ThiI